MVDIIELVFSTASSLKRGGSAIIKCPNCGADLRVSKSEFNGHVWGVCDKEGILLQQ